MKNPVSIEKQGTVAVLRVDNPPVNALGSSVRHGLRDAMRQVLDDPQYAAVVLVCAGRTFISGADIREFGQKLPWKRIGRPGSPVTTAPASPATRHPAAKSHGLRCRS